MSLENPYNPDVLTCLANLSNDEVFTPPALANQILDLLPSSIWQSKEATFLDPASKTGVFLREIVKRLDVGLESSIPDRSQRVKHILTKQVFGLAITELTSLLSRRTLYCSKNANSKHSIAENFSTPDGNVKFERSEHVWEGDKCIFCGASIEIHNRGDELESHAYRFIHTHKPESIFNMKFDVIIGNPPYQLNVGVEKENYAIALYQKFVEQAKKLNPRFLTMVIPARWYAGGRGLDDFREEMLNDSRIRKIVDYPNAVDCFPGVDIAGGVCYFLWDRDNKGTCEIKTFKGNQIVSTMTRNLLEDDGDTFIRFNEAIPILRKIKSKNEKTFDSLVSPQTPFGLTSTFKDFKSKPFDGSVSLHTSSGIGYVTKEQIPRNHQWIKSWKVYISKAYGERGSYPYLFLGKPFLGKQNTCCTQTYLMLGPFNNKTESENVMSYIRTKFFRFCIMLKKNTQDAMRDKYSIVPIQDFSETWTDEKLYKKYGLDESDIAFIDSMIRPMEVGNEA